MDSIVVLWSGAERQCMFISKPVPRPAGPFLEGVWQKWWQVTELWWQKERHTQFTWHAEPESFSSLESVFPSTGRTRKFFLFGKCVPVNRQNQKVFPLWKVCSRQQAEPEFFLFGKCVPVNRQNRKVFPLLKVCSRQQAEPESFSSLESVFPSTVFVHFLPLVLTGISRADLHWFSLPAVFKLTTLLCLRPVHCLNLWTFSNWQHLHAFARFTVNLWAVFKLTSLVCGSPDSLSKLVDCFQTDNTCMPSPDSLSTYGLFSNWQQSVTPSSSPSSLSKFVGCFQTDNYQSHEVVCSVYSLNVWAVLILVTFYHNSAVLLVHCLDRNVRNVFKLTTFYHSAVLLVHCLGRNVWTVYQTNNILPHYAVLVHSLNRNVRTVSN